MRIALCHVAAHFKPVSLLVGLVSLCMPTCIASLVLAQERPVPAREKLSLAGDYSGEIGMEPVTLHLKISTDGVLSGTLDQLDPAAPWMFVLADLHFDGHALSFAIPSANATWRGIVGKNGAALSGAWTQKGTSLPVDFALQRFIPAAKPSPVDGIWLGEIAATAGKSTRVQVVVKSDIAGREYCALDALDLYYSDLQCTKVVLSGSDFAFDVPTVGIHWKGTLSADGDALTGTSHVTLIEDGTTQDVPQGLSFRRQSALTPMKAKPVSAFDAAMPPVSAAELQPVLDRDLAESLKSGELAPATGGGVSIAVYDHGVRRIFSYGAAKPDSIYEIGSITKAFTGLLLAQMTVEGKVKLDEPVRELLPSGVVAKPAGREITLLDLATQRSGLPAMPDNINLSDLDQPYASYHAADLMAYLVQHGVANPNHASSSFGALGFGLLGFALANRAGTSYDDLLKGEIAAPLGLKDTALELNAEQQARLIAGHDQYHGPAQPWKVDALAGAIAIRSTAGDMLTYLEACLHPEKLQTPVDPPASSSIAAALRLSLQPQSEVIPGMRIALGWLYQPETGNYWHNGATAAYSSYAFFNPTGDYAAVVLFNVSPGVNGSFVEVLGRHIYKRLAGKPAISLSQPSAASPAN
jgi:CubicO group peptidase (beta-lactamase class C family)